ncbi:MAG: hypothetical protein ACJ77U_08830, partial [Chloroflexota bacterium]
WRPANDGGKGTLTKVTLEGSASLGDDVVGINTFLRPGTRGLYNLYIVDPSEQQIRAYPPAADGSGFPGKPQPWLATARDVSQFTSTFVDGDVFVTDGGQLLRFVGGKAEGWDPKEPKDTDLRPAPVYSILASGSARREGEIYAFDKANARVIALSKVDGSFKGQYRLAGGNKDWADLRGMYVVPGAEGQPSTLVWMGRDGVNQAILVAVPDTAPSASPSQSAAPSQSTKPAKATPKPKKP